MPTGIRSTTITAFKLPFYLVVMTIMVSSLNGCSLNENAIASEDDSRSIQLPKGARSLLTLVERDSSSSSKIEVEILQPPTHGVLQEKESPGRIFYQHGGATSQADQFTYRWRILSNNWQTKTVHLTFRPLAARVKILSPANEQHLPPGEVLVTYETSGGDFNHLHITLDGEGHNTIRDLNGTFTLKEVGVGRHEISAQLVDANHRSVRGPESRDEVHISVR